MVRLEKKIQALLHKVNSQRNVPTRPATSSSIKHVRNVEYRMHRSLSGPRLFNLAFNIFLSHVGEAGDGGRTGGCWCVGCRKNVGGLDSEGLDPDNNREQTPR